MSGAAFSRRQNSLAKSWAPPWKKLRRMVTRASMSHSLGRLTEKGRLPMRYIPYKLFLAVMALAVVVGCGGGVTPTAQAPRNNYDGMSTTPTEEDLGNLAW